MFTCSKCGSNEFEKKEKGPHFGLYCKKCGTWHHWLSKKELKEFREPTKEERDSVNSYVESISHDTGVNFTDETTLKERLQEFIDYLDQLVSLNDPTIKILVGDKKENYDYLSKHIKTIVSDDIYSGIKIVYKDKVYDFSLSERNA